ncbi:acyl-CoA carboxylase epsilon subunit [Actinotalea sp. Marseille-Q4924]|uniref:acyl-CoA carboxylase epsilon subunit n=1 Tax=Actinotalea sp. Marseille-Q4924 TaxID=2866571 RepID=UPI001CE4842F|nr:acyl-CoA carboxylase epsilon subunit [Actinotalea sp. Marseille-Q4924]
MTPPDVRVVRGAPDDVELAALVAGLAAGAQSADDDAAHLAADPTPSVQARRRWRDAANRLSDRLSPGPDAWRWSTHP